MTQENSNIPELGKIYHMFDDGKITLARHSLVKCNKVIPFADFTNHRMYSSWKHDVADCDWIYAPETDYIVECKVITPLCAAGNTLYYTRTLDGGWFGFGTCLDDGRLDVDRKAWHIFMEDVHAGRFDYNAETLAKIEELNKI